jgi:hypothetical protein
MYVDSKCVVNDKLRNIVYEYLANMGVKQGDGASPELFILFLTGYTHTYNNTLRRRVLPQPNDLHTLSPLYNFLCWRMQMILYCWLLHPRSYRVYLIAYISFASRTH